MSTPPGMIRIEHPDATEVFIQGTLRPAAVQARSEPYRPPFSDAWHSANDGKDGAQLFTLTTEVWTDHEMGITVADWQPLVAMIQAAALIEGQLGTIVPDGVLSTSISPIVAGYRLDITVVARTGRISDTDLDDLVLRFISGPVWQLR